MSNLYALKVPSFLTLDQKLSKANIAESFGFLSVTGFFLLGFDSLAQNLDLQLKAKQNSKQWTELGCSVPKTVKSISPVGEVMALIFRSSNLILLIIYGWICFFPKKEVLYYHLSGFPHKSQVIMVKLLEFMEDLDEYPPHLAPTHFSQRNKISAWKHFKTNESPIPQENFYF